jgi:iron complex outermembrane receptor protein
MSGSTHGLELASDWKPTNWLKLQLGYTYLGFDLKVEADSLSSNLAEITEFVSPQHQFSIQSAININKDLQLNLWARYVDTLKASRDIRFSDMTVDEYLTLDANVVWRPMEKLELMLVGQNLLNSSHLEYVSEFSTPLTEIERSVYGKLTYRF